MDIYSSCCESITQTINFNTIRLFFLRKLFLLLRSGDPPERGVKTSTFAPLGMVESRERKLPSKMTATLSVMACSKLSSAKLARRRGYSPARRKKTPRSVISPSHDKVRVRWPIQSLNGLANQKVA